MGRKDRGREREIENGWGYKVKQKEIGRNCVDLKREREKKTII